MPLARLKDRQLQLVVEQPGTHSQEESMNKLDMLVNRTAPESLMANETDDTYADQQKHSQMKPG